MPRSQQNSSTKSFSTHKAPSALTVRPRSPPVVYQTPTQAGFGQLIKEGIGFGAGQAIAHRAVNAIFGSTTTAPSSLVQQSADPKNPCYSERSLFETCMKIKTQDDHCTNEHLAYTQCLDLTQKSQ